MSVPLTNARKVMLSMRRGQLDTLNLDLSDSAPRASSLADCNLYPLDLINQDHESNFQ